MTSPSSFGQILGIPSTEEEADAFASRLLVHFLTHAESRMSDTDTAAAAAALSAGDAEGLARLLRAAVPDLDTRMSALLPAA